MSNFADVGRFHKKFGLPTVTHDGAFPRVFPLDLLEFRIKFMQEELDEYREAAERCDHEGMFDALLDLVYVAMGTAHMQGFPWNEGWQEVQRANMSKVRAAADGSDSKRKSRWDVVKPPGWVAPAIGKVLNKFGWDL